MRHAGPATAPRGAGRRQKKKQGRDAEASGQGLAYLSGELAASHGWTRSSSSPHVGKQRVIISRPAWAVAAHDHMVRMRVCVVQQNGAARGCRSQWQWQCPDSARPARSTAHARHLSMHADRASEHDDCMSSSSSSRTDKRMSVRVRACAPRPLHCSRVYPICRVCCSGTILRKRNNVCSLTLWQIGSCMAFGLPRVDAQLLCLIEATGNNCY